MAGNLRKFTLSLTSAADGSGTGYLGDAVNGIANVAGINGRIVAIQYVPDGSNAYSSFTVTVTGENNGQAILTNASVAAAFFKYPLVAATKAADGSASTLSEVQPVVIGERVKVVLSGAGNAKVGVFNVFVE